jgi:hypothetical protein
MIKIENTKIASHKTVKSPQFVAKNADSPPPSGPAFRTAPHVGQAIGRTRRGCRGNDTDTRFARLDACLTANRTRDCGLVRRDGLGCHDAVKPIPEKQLGGRGERPARSTLAIPYVRLKSQDLPGVHAEMV